MSSLKKLEDYIDNYESKQLSFSSSRLPRTSSTKRVGVSASRRSEAPLPSTRAKSPAKEHRQETHALQRLEYFTAALKQRALVRAHELRQLRLMLTADLDWDCEVSADLKLSSILPHPSDLRDDEYQTIIMGDSMLGMPKTSPPRSMPRGPVSADESVLNAPFPASIKWEGTEYQRTHGEKLQRLKLLMHSIAQPSADPISPPKRATASAPRASSDANSRRFSENPPTEARPLRPSSAASFAQRSRSDDSAEPVVGIRESSEGLRDAALEPDLLQNSIQSLHSYRAQSRAAAPLSSTMQFVRARSEQSADGDEPVLDLFSLARETVHIAGASVSAASTPSRQPRTPQFNPLFS